MILVALLCASFVSFTWIILMRFLTGVMVWTSIFLLIVGSGGGLGYSVYRYLTQLIASFNIIYFSSSCNHFKNYLFLKVSSIERCSGRSTKYFWSQLYSSIFPRRFEITWYLVSFYCHFKHHIHRGFMSFHRSPPTHQFGNSNDWTWIQSSFQHAFFNVCSYHSILVTRCGDCLVCWYWLLHGINRRTRIQYILWWGRNR